MKNMYKIYFLLSLLLTSFGVSAENVDVVATPPSGTYYAPVYITLTPTQPGTKTFYSFKPDGYPQDAFLYEKPLLLKHSTPLIYFSIISTSNESKIKQNDYIIEYSSAIHFENESVSGSWQVDVTIVNSGSESVNIGFWYVQSESDTVTIPEGTMITSGATYNISLNYQGTSSVVLRSPDDDERDILTSENIPEMNEVIPPKKRNITTKVVPRKIISTRETTKENTEPVSGNVDMGANPSSPWTSFVEEKTSLPETVLDKEIPQLDINQIMKASTAESGQKSLNPLYPIIFLLLSFGIGWIQWFVRRKQK